ncbi:MAG TPA: tetratricopeptide repeat protein [Candidatus Acidoferrales bacterium]|nr:tetratricopeptide repeat protein [Candidatus Acidoferrales bacterium]
MAVLLEMTVRQSGSKSGSCLPGYRAEHLARQAARTLDKVAGFRDSRSMANKRAARAANPRGTLTSGGPKENPAQSANPNPQAIRFSDFVLWATIFCATLTAYLPALDGGLLWDDSSHLTKPGLQSFHGLWRIWFELGATQQYYPLLHSAFWLEHRMWGDAVAGYHLTNVALHTLSACLIVMIMKRLALPGAWFAGFVFALHPVQVESVAWISEQKSTLSGVFYLASLLTYLHFDSDRRKSKYLLATVLFVLALLSKTVTATLPAVLLVIFWWRRGRLEWRRDVQPLLPWFALGISAGLVTSWVERTLVGARGADFLLTPVQRVLIAGRAICFYAGKLLWPTNLMFFYPHWKIDPGVWWQWLFPAGLLALGTGLVFAARRYRGPLASFLIFSGTLFPVLGFLNVYPFRYSYVADHFQYLASLGIIVPVTSLLAGTIERISLRRAVTIACCFMLILVLGILTWRQSRMYRDVETLYRESLARNPGSWLAHYNLGVLFAEMPGRLADAIAEYQAALQIKPDYAEAHVNLGDSLSQIPGRLPDAIAEYQAALQINPDYAEAHNDLGIALSFTPGRLADAIAEYQAALRIKPDYAEAHVDLGNTLSQMPGRQPQAIAEYQAALRIRPDNAEAHYNLGNLLARTPGRLQDAIAEYQAALRINPDYAKAHYNLGIVLAVMPGRLPDAIAEYQAALRINPDYAEAYINLGNCLSQIPGRQPEAIAAYQAALRIRPDYANLLSERIKVLRRSRPPSEK